MCARAECGDANDERTEPCADIDGAAPNPPDLADVSTGAIVAPIPKVTKAAMPAAHFFEIMTPTPRLRYPAASKRG
jgi:hypothetical protein